jgi:hypothetical protein
VSFGQGGYFRVLFEKLENPVMAAAGPNDDVSLGWGGEVDEYITCAASAWWEL